MNGQFREVLWCIYIYIYIARGCKTPEIRVGTQLMPEEHLLWNMVSYVSGRLQQPYETISSSNSEARYVLNWHYFNNLSSCLTTYSLLEFYIRRYANTVIIFSYSHIQHMVNRTKIARGTVAITRWQIGLCLELVYSESGPRTIWVDFSRSPEYCRMNSERRKCEFCVLLCIATLL